MDQSADTFTLEELLLHQRWAERLALVLVGDPAAAQDVLQETWIAALEKPPRRDRPVRGWLATVVRNFAAQRRRREGRLRHREEAAAREEGLPSSFELAQRLDGQRMLTEKVMSLPDIYRDTIVLHYFEGLTLVEIARRGGEPGATVRARLRRGLKLLRESVDKTASGKRGEGLLVLVPLARRAKESAAPPPVWPAALESPALAVALTAGLGLVVVIGVRAGLSGRDPESSLAVTAVTPDADIDTGPTPRTLPIPERGSRASRLPAGDLPVTLRAQEPESAGAPDDPAPGEGWWLLGDVPPVARGTAPATLVISRARGFDVGALHAVLPAHGRVRVDLAPLFTDETFLPRRLHVALSHPALVDSGQELDVSREQRQRGFLPGEPATWTLTGDWTVARGIVEGAVRVPPASDVSRVLTALFRCDDAGRPSPQPSAIRVVSPAQGDGGVESSLAGAKDGTFRLPASGSGSYVLVAVALDARSSRAHPELAPITRRVPVTVGASLTEPIDLAPGAVVDGRVECAGLPARRCRIALDVVGDGPPGELVPLALDLFPGVSLAWNGEAFVHRTIDAVTDDAGRFVVGALEAGAHRARLLGPALPSGAAIPTVRAGVNPKERAIMAPATGMTLAFDVGCSLLCVTRDGRPVNGAATVGFGGARTQRDGLLGVLRPASQALAIEIRGLWGEGAIARLAPPALEERECVDVELASAGSPGRLELDVLGDPERSIEALTLELFHADDRDALVMWKRTRRLAGPLVFGEIPPGRYVLRAKPAAYGTGDALAGVFVPATIELDVAAGERIRRPLLLERGGCLRVPRGRFGSVTGELSFRVLDRSGDEHRVDFVSEHDTQRYGELPLDRDVRTAPALPAGLYELEVWEESGARRRFPFELRPGAESVLEVE